MTDDIVPRLYIEDSSLGPKTIEGVRTSTAGFVGPTCTGPLSGEPKLLTSLAHFESIYGDGRPLDFGDAGRTTNWMWHAARAFFEEGGARLFVARVHKTGGKGDDASGDGDRPGSIEYAGMASGEGAAATGLAALEGIDEISVVAAPGATSDMRGAYADDAKAITTLLIDHVERMRYRFAVLESGDGASLDEVREQRASVDSTRAALYYPWVRAVDPGTKEEITLPPGGFVAGIFARVDATRGVWTAPANEVVRLATGFERAITKEEQELLNPEGINCFRSFAGRGERLWGARTTSSDPEWKYVNVRRYLTYLEQSIDRGTQWVVFEPNGEPTWTQVRASIENFLLAEWKSGALLGSKPEEGFFVKCDRTTMTQGDIDSGRLICLMGVAPVKPAEFVIFRIGQWTADRDE